MKRFFCNSLFYIGIVIMILLGIAVGYNIDHNFLKLYTAKMGQVPIRYCIFIIILFIDYLLFEEINHYTFIFRYKSVSNFIIKSMKQEVIMSVILLLIFHLPIFILNTKEFINNIVLIMLVILNITLIFSVMLAIIRLLNVWINNRITSTSIFLLVFACLDVLLGYFSYFYMEHYIFDFDAILVLPYVYHFYPFIFSFMCTLDIVLLFVTSKKMKERDYIIKQNEICE